MGMSFVGKASYRFLDGRFPDGKFPKGKFVISKFIFDKLQELTRKHYYPPFTVEQPSKFLVKS